MPRLTGFIGPSSETQSVVAGSDRTINLIPSKTESGTAAAPYVFDPAPGFDLAVTGGAGVCRASYQQNQKVYMLIGRNLVEVVVFPVASITTLVTIGAGGFDTPGSITGGNFGSSQIVVADVQDVIYWYNTTTTASGSIATVPGRVVAFMDGFFIALDVANSTMYSSDLNDATTWDPLNFAQRTDYPDQWMTMIVRSKELFVFGRQTTSVYVDDPNADAFPLSPNTNVAINRGIHAPASLALLQNNPIWLADDKTVRYMQGYTPVRVSTHALEYVLSRCEGGLEDADGYTYEEGGHSFYVLNVSAAVYTISGEFDLYRRTWVYDLSTGLWHERATPTEEAFEDGWDQLDAIWGIKVGSTAGIQNINIVGSRTDSKVYFMSQEFSTEIDGTTLITVQRTAPVIVEELKRIIHHYFILFAEVGTSTTAGTLTLEFSDNGGQSYTTHSTISAGTLNNFDTRLLFRKLGLARNRVYRLTGTNITRPRWVDAFINSVPGAS